MVASKHLNVETRDGAEADRKINQVQENNVQAKTCWKHTKCC